MEIQLATDSRYRIDRNFVKQYLGNLWREKDLPNGIISVAFVGKRKGRELAKKYLHDNIEHPVLTFPYKNGEEIISDQSRTPALLGEIVICYPQVTLFAAQNNREINKVIAQFLDHAANILKQKLKE